MTHDLPNKNALSIPFILKRKAQMFSSSVFQKNFRPEYFFVLLSIFCHSHGGFISPLQTCTSDAFLLVSRLPFQQEMKFNADQKQINISNYELTFGSHIKNDQFEKNSKLNF